MGFDLGKYECSSADRAHSNVTSVQVQLSTYQVPVASKFSEVGVLGILHSASKNK